IGHTGDLAAGIKCCEAVDRYLGEIVETYRKEGGTVIITADHGNVEEMVNLETGEIDTEHSTNLVPFIIVNDGLKNKIKLGEGSLGDIAPTILDLLNIRKPKKMKGENLVR
ncbi:MAG: sulfatase-like hydrolase/transferase, partial [Patescibacteria group bacterium]